jgi:siroheme decarboxylase
MDAMTSPLLARLAQGLPLTPTPYADIAAELGVSEEAVLAQLAASDAVSRFGVIVDHAALGFCVNAMVVWAVPAVLADEAGRRVAAAGLASLCYRRETRPDWPYSLYTMLHGRSREEIEARIGKIAETIGLPGLRHEALYTVKRYKQTAARYDREGAAP